MFGLRKIILQRQHKKININYDHEHDILYISIGKPIPSFSDDEKLKGVYIRRAKGTDIITGATVMDYSKRNKQVLQKYIPFKVDLSTIS